MSDRYGPDRIRRGLLHFILGKGVSSIAGFLAMVLVVRLLSFAEFAEYSVLVALVEIFTALTGLGIGHGMLRYVPELYIKRYRTALRQIVMGGLLIRSAALVLAVLLAWRLSDHAAPLIGLDGSTAGFNAYLLIVLFRVSTYSLSQILESTLHQGIVQLAFTFSSVLRLAGMLWLMSMHQGSLIEVIHVEVLSDIAACGVLLVGLFKEVVFARQFSSDAQADAGWLRGNMKSIVRFCASGYMQHLAGLPFGANTNRLVGSHLLNDRMMASFGFSLSLYEYAKRYLPAQLLVGLIRPVVVARYAASGDFSLVAKLCDRIVQANLFLQGFLFVALGTAGLELLQAVSGGKYGLEARWILLSLMLVLTLETNRLILEVLAQTVERYAILIPSNLLLAASILPGMLLVPYFGAKAMPLCNALALFVANAWVKLRLAREGYYYRNNWREFSQCFLLIILSSLFGAALHRGGMHWVPSEAIALLGYLIAGLLLRGQSLRTLARDFMSGAGDAGSNIVVASDPAAGNGSRTLHVKIMSMQRVRNYGSFMQAYALRKLIENHGHMVSFCDFQHGLPRHLGQKVVAGGFIYYAKQLPALLLHPLAYFGKLRFRAALNACFVERVWPTLGVRDKPDYDTRCDLFVIGSDEVFNYTQNHAFGYVPTLFGHGVASQRLVSYAASAGYASMEDIERDGMAREIGSGLARFDQISVRDENTFNMVEKYARRTPTLVLDPTLIYDFTPDVPAPVIKPGYLLVYAYEGRFNDPLQIATVRALSRHKGLRLVSIGSFQAWCDESIVLSPFEVLAAFRDASYVVTDTFHGSIFAIKFHKSFVSMLRRHSDMGSNSNKLEFLLSQLGLSSRVVEKVTDIERCLDLPIDYDAVEARMLPLQEQSRRYLAGCLDVDKWQDANASMGAAA